MPTGDEYNQYQPTSPGPSASSRLEPWQQTLAEIPIVNMLGGADAANAARAQDAATVNRQYWDQLAPPTQRQLMGPSEDRDAQMSALQQMQQWSSGRLTSTDQANMETQRAAAARTSAGQRGALMQHAQARGVGGSGADLATQQMADQAGQTQASESANATMQGAQSRGLAATQARSQMAGALRTQDVDATQQAYEDAANRASGATQQYSGDASRRLQQQQLANQQGQAAVSGLAALIS